MVSDCCSYIYRLHKKVVAKEYLFLSWEVLSYKSRLVEQVPSISLPFTVPQVFVWKFCLWAFPDRSSKDPFDQSQLDFVLLNWLGCYSNLRVGRGRMYLFFLIIDTRFLWHLEQWTLLQESTTNAFEVPVKIWLTFWFQWTVTYWFFVLIHSFNNLINIFSAQKEKSILFLLDESCLLNLYILSIRTSRVNVPGSVSIDVTGKVDVVKDLTGVKAYRKYKGRTARKEELSNCSQHLKLSSVIKNYGKWVPISLAE